jgi:hypothetical protein
MQFRDDADIDAAVNNIFTSNYVRSKAVTMVSGFGSTNDFINRKGAEYLENFYVPRIDYNSLIIVSGSSYRKNADAGYESKVYVENIVNYEGMNLLVGVRAAF